MTKGSVAFIPFRVASPLSLLEYPFRTRRKAEQRLKSEGPTVSIIESCADVPVPLVTVYITREKFMKQVVVALLCILAAGCATTYKQPTMVAPDTSQSISGSQPVLLRAAKQVLVSEGFQITNSDETAGVVSTAPRDMRLTPELADCGTTLGLDYLKDNRTSSKVGYGVLVSENKVTLKANMSATYLPANDSQSITLTCVSRGVLEGQLLAKMAAAAKR